MRFDDKVAIVAGGGRDIGKAVAERLAAGGAKVAVSYLNSREGALSTVREIESAGGTAMAIPGDMTNQSDVENLVAETRMAFGDSIHVLVNVVGGLVARKSLREMDEPFFEKVLRLNVTSVFLATKAVVPYMSEGSSIVNFSSLAGRDGGGPGAAAYATSKGAVMTFTRAMAKELGPNKIRVNCVCPGMINTSFHDTFTKPAVRQSVAAATPLRREGEAGEVADLVAYLASDASSFLTGASIDINGGVFFS